MVHRNERVLFYCYINYRARLEVFNKFHHSKKITSGVEIVTALHRTKLDYCIPNLFKEYARSRTNRLGHGIFPKIPSDVRCFSHYPLVLVYEWIIRAVRARLHSSSCFFASLREKSGTALGVVASSVIQLRRSPVGMTQRLLHILHRTFLLQCRCRKGRAIRMRGKASCNPQRPLHIFP